MRKSLGIKNIDSMLHNIALTARGCVVEGAATEAEILDHIREVGNDEINKAFTMTEGELAREMLKEMAKKLDKMKGSEDWK